MLIRAESSLDYPAVTQIHRAAFPTQAEADLVQRLREKASPCISLAAEHDAVLVGHIFFSPAMLVANTTPRLMGLAPVAVLPKWQGQGVGSALIEAGIQKCRELAADAVVVLGAPAYYSRFGFKSSQMFDLHCQYDVPPGAFMVLELNPGSLSAHTGLIRYHPEFDRL